MPAIGLIYLDSSFLGSASFLCFFWSSFIAAFSDSSSFPSPFLSYFLSNSAWQAALSFLAPPSSAAREMEVRPVTIETATAINTSFFILSVIVFYLSVSRTLRFCISAGRTGNRCLGCATWHLHLQVCADKFSSRLEHTFRGCQAGAGLSLGQTADWTARLRPIFIGQI